MLIGQSAEKLKATRDGLAEFDAVAEFVAEATDERNK